MYDGDVLLVDNIAELDRDLAALLHAGDVDGLIAKWITPIADDAERRELVRYCSERIFSMLMGRIA